MPDSIHNRLSPILAKFGIADSVGADHSSLRIEDLKNAGGFSGANIWRIDWAGEQFCLRRWPAGTDPDRVAWIHSNLFAAANRGFDRLSLPRVCTSAVAGRHGSSFVEFRTRIFELSPWLPGVADFELSSGADRDAKLASAMTTLAEFHYAMGGENLANEANQGPSRESRPSGAGRLSGLRGEDNDARDGSSASGLQPTTAFSPGLQVRAARCQRLLQGGLGEIRIAMEQYCSAAKSEMQKTTAQPLPILVREFERLAPTVLARLQQAATQPTTLQPCFRDIWHDHVLFAGNHVSGIVDYDAMQNETPATDIARLLGSLVGNDRDSWQSGLHAYESHRTLTNADRALIEAFDLGNALLSGLQWVSWICVEGKQFSDMPAVLRRLHHWRDRIQGRSATDRLCL